MLFSPLFSQVRLSFDHEDFSNISVGYGQVFHKQDNIKLGIGVECMFPRSSTNFSDNEFSFNENNLLTSIYMFMRFAYEKRWSSYLRVGINSFESDNENSDGRMVGFGASYKLSDNWYINSGYHLYSADSYNYSSVVYSISRYFKVSDED